MNKIKIKKTWYKIKYEEAPLLGDSKCYGYCDVDNKLIVILKGLSKKEALQTLKHECLHAIEEEYGTNIPHKVIYALEEPLADLIKHNYKPKRACKPR